MTWEERVQLGEAKTLSTQSIPDFPYAKYAELLGLKGIFVDQPDLLRTAWQEALQADRPVILGVRTDPNVPPLPPHITLKDAKHFLTSLLHEPELGSVIVNSAREVLASVCRLHGSEELYTSGYGEAALKDWHRYVVAWAEGKEPKKIDLVPNAPRGNNKPRDVFLYFDNGVKR